MTDETLFAAALDKPDPTERAAYLDAACPDPGQRRRVEALLAAHTDAGGFLERPAVGPADTSTLPADVAPADPGPATLPADVPSVAALAVLRPSDRPGSLGRVAHYEVQEVLGSGGFGTVFKAFDDRLHRVVAVKVLAPQLAASGAARARFLREGRSAAAVRDEHVVGVHAVSDDGEPVPYLVMEFVSGQTLQQKLDKAGPLPVKEVLRIGGQIARGLAAAHATGLIHRDIKPANVLLENGVERVKIADFGLARAADDASISHSGVVAGTPVFMSPEQARGDKVDHRSDLFSLGSVLYALCTGHPPFRAETTMGVLKRVIEDAPRPIRQTNADVPEWLCRVVEKLHAKSPADRFQTAAEVADLLADCMRQLQAHGTLADAARIPAKRTAALGPPKAGQSIALVLIGSGVLLLALFGASMLSRPNGPVMRYLENRNEVVIYPTDGLLAVVVSKDGQPVLGPIDVRDGVTVTLPPGEYRLGGIFAPGRALAYWAGEGEGLHFNTVASRWEPSEYYLPVRRGDRTTVRAVLRDVPIPPALEDGWTSLFNGKDLSGWAPHPNAPGDWRVEDGAVVGLGDTSFLFSDREYADFHLRMEAKVNATGDAGVFFRAPFNVGVARTKEPILAGGYEAQLAVRANYPVHTGAIVLVYPQYVPAPLDPHRADEWVRLEVIAEGNHLSTRVNGQPAATYRDAQWRFTRGRIALQVWGAGITRAHFRKIEIKEFPPVAVPELVEVLAAARDLPVGTTFTPDALKNDVTRTKVPKNKLPAGAVTDLAVLADKRLTRALRAGEPFDARDLGSGGLALPPGHKLMSVSIPPGAAGFAAPGARVDVWVALGDEKRPRAFRLLADVLIVAIGTEANAKGEIAPAMISFAVRDADAELLTLAQGRNGRLSLALRLPGAAGADPPHDPAAVRKQLQEP